METSNLNKLTIWAEQTIKSDKPIDLNYEILKENDFLLAISGGLDSMVLLNLFRKSKLSFAVAHVNFQLRGEDSQKDEDLVRDYCEKYNISFFLKKINPLEFQKARNSLQMIARKIRYDFFKQVMDLNKLTVLVTAHHLDDQIETFFINLFRGSGLKGLSGMKEFKKEIYRPFLNNTRDQLEIYAKKNELIWREDSSNQKNDYLRNKIRLDLIPKMFEIQPNYKNQITKSIQYIQEAETIIESNSKIEFSKVLHHFDEKTETYFLKLNKLKSLNSTFLYYIFNDFGGFHSNELPKFLNSVSGTTLENEMFKFWIDFKFLIIEPKKEFIPTYIELSTYKFKLKHPIKLKSKVLEQMDSTAEAWFDADKIILPLIIRTWKNDDIFFPLGMNGRKKVSKLLKDEKISNYYKQNIMVLTNAKNEIIWVVNHRTDERFKVTNQTKKILNIWI